MSERYIFIITSLYGVFLFKECFHNVFTTCRNAFLKFLVRTFEINKKYINIQEYTASNIYIN